MLIHTWVSIPLQTVDPSKAFQKASSLLKRATTNYGKTDLHLLLQAGTGLGILEHLAKALPKSTPGFAIGSTIPKYSAEEYLAKDPTCRRGDMASYSGPISDHLAFEKSLATIDRLLAPISSLKRRLHYSCWTKEIAWTGAPKDSKGEWHFWAERNARTVPTFKLNVELQSRGESTQDPQWRTILQKIAGHTGIDFLKGSHRVEPDVGETSSLSPQELLVFELYFEEALHQTTEEVRRHKIRCDDLPGLATHMNAFRHRMKAISGQKAQKVNFRAATNKVVKAELPNFAVKRFEYGEAWYVKPLTPELALAFEFDNNLGGRTGKQFTLSLGLLGMSRNARGLRWRENLFRVFGFDNSSFLWAYNKQPELESALREAVGLLKTVLPIYEASTMTCFSPFPRTFPPKAICRGPITARQGWKEALQAAEEWAKDATAYQISVTGPRLSLADINVLMKTHELFDASVGKDGKVAPHSAWGYAFYSIRNKETFYVEVPYIGNLQAQRSVSEFLNSLSEHHLPIENEWIDSDRAVGIAKRAVSKKKGVRIPIRCELKTEESSSEPLPWADWDFSQLREKVKAGWKPSLKDIKHRQLRLRWEVSGQVREGRAVSRLRISFNAKDGSDIRIESD